MKLLVTGRRKDSLKGGKGGKRLERRQSSPGIKKGGSAGKEKRLQKEIRGREYKSSVNRRRGRTGVIAEKRKKGGERPDQIKLESGGFMNYSLGEQKSSEEKGRKGKPVKSWKRKKPGSKKTVKYAATGLEEKRNVISGGEDRWGGPRSDWGEGEL